MPAITKSQILILATNGFEQSELEVPLDKLREHGATVHVATPDGNAICGWDKSDWGNSVEADLAFEDVNVNAYDAIVLPGGQINPDILRLDDAAMAIIRMFIDQGKTVAAICHAPWLLIEAGAVSGREVTSYPSIKTDMVNAGGRWMDEQVICDRGIITSRNPGDLDAFVKKIVEEIETDAARTDAA